MVENEQPSRHKVLRRHSAQDTDPEHDLGGSQQPGEQPLARFKDRSWSSTAMPATAAMVASPYVATDTRMCRSSQATEFAGGRRSIGSAAKAAPATPIATA